MAKGKGEKIGGFWASLDLISDKKSFDKGIKSLNEVKKTVTGLASFITKVVGFGGAGLIGFTGTMAQMERKNGLVAKSLGISNRELSAWNMTANVAGISADNLTGSMLELEKKVNRMKLGEVDVGLAKSLGMLGVGFNSFNVGDSSKRMSMVMEKAMGMQDKEKAGELVRDVLGDAGKDMFTYLQMSGRSLDSILAESKQLTFTSDKTRKGAMMFDAEMKAVVGSGKEMMGLFGGQLSIELLPLIKNIKNLIIANKGIIASNIVKFAKEIGKIARDVFNVLRTGIPFVINLVQRLGGLGNILKYVALGFAIFTTGKLVFGIANVVKGIGGLSALLKGGVAGLGMTAGFLALFLIIEDIATYMSGGDSLLGRALKWIKEEFGTDLTGSVDEMLAHWKNGFKDFFKGIKENFEGVINVVHAVQEALKGNWKEAGDYLGKAGSKFLSGFVDTQILLTDNAKESIKKGDIKGLLFGNTSLKDSAESRRFQNSFLGKNYEIGKNYSGGEGKELMRRYQNWKNMVTLPLQGMTSSIGGSFSNKIQVEVYSKDKNLGTNVKQNNKSVNGNKATNNLQLKNGTK